MSCHAGGRLLCLSVNRPLMSSQVGHHPNHMKRLDIMSDSDLPSITPLQLKLDLQIAAEREIDGVGMGLLQRKFHLQPIDMPWRIRQLLHPAALNYFELGASKLSRIGGRRNSNRSLLY